jgi:hypothetical protein
MRKNAIQAAVAVAALAGISTSAHAALTFNELMYDAPGSNPNKRFFEVKSSVGVESLANVSILAIEGDGTAGRGGVDFATSFGNVSTGTNGLALLRDGTAVLEPAPDPATTVVVDAYAYNENTTVTYLLVSGFTGTAGTTDIDADDDGVADSTPWTAVLDAVGFRDAATDPLYAAQFGGVDYNEADAPYSGADIFGFLRDDTGTRHTFRVTSPDADGPFTVDLSPTLPTGYTLTPGSANNAVPEPASLALLALGGLGLVARRRRA